MKFEKHFFLKKYNSKHFFKYFTTDSIISDFFTNSIFLKNFETCLIFHTNDDKSIKTQILEMFYEQLNSDSYSENIISNMLMKKN